MSVYAKLLEVQRKLKAPKSQYNQFGKYNYRSAEDILEAVKPVCGEVGAVIFMSDTVRFVEGRHYIEATATFADVDSGEFIQVKASAREDESKKGMDGAQLSGATSSYARKYALNGLLDVDDCKDSDELDGAEAKTAALTPADIVYFCDLCGNEVTATKKRDGTMWEPKDMAVYSRMKYDGKCLCAACMKTESKKC